MNCDTDGTKMQRIGYELSKDQKQIVETIMCPLCFRRKTQQRTNPRYVALVQAQQQSEAQALQEQARRQKASQDYYRERNYAQFVGL